jgi:hypothetical protein
MIQRIIFSVAVSVSMLVIIFITLFVISFNLMHLIIDF